MSEYKYYVSNWSGNLWRTKENDVWSCRYRTLDWSPPEHMLDAEIQWDLRSITDEEAMMELLYSKSNDVSSTSSAVFVIGIPANVLG